MTSERTGFNVHDYIASLTDDEFIALCEAAKVASRPTVVLMGVADSSPPADLDLPDGPGPWRRQECWWQINVDGVGQVTGGWPMRRDGTIVHHTTAELPRGNWHRVSPPLSADERAELERLRAENERLQNDLLAKIAECHSIREAVKNPDKLFASQLECAAADKVRDLQAANARLQEQVAEAEKKLEAGATVMETLLLSAAQFKEQHAAANATIEAIRQVLPQSWYAGALAIAREKLEAAEQRAAKAEAVEAERDRLRKLVDFIYRKDAEWRYAIDNHLGIE